MGGGAIRECGDSRQCDAGVRTRIGPGRAPLRPDASRLALGFARENRAAWSVQPFDTRLHESDAVELAEELGARPLATAHGGDVLANERSSPCIALPLPNASPRAI